MGRTCDGRRRFLLGAAAAGAALAASARGEAKEEPKEPEVSPTEDLMREHGVLRRLLLVYGEVIRRVGAGEAVPPAEVARAAEIIRAFVEDYHEKDEEEVLFPRFRAAGKMTALIDVLVEQHRAGRRLTSRIAKLATPAAMSAAANRHELAEAMKLFIRMYEPHAAREDTVLFPAFAALVGEKELERIADTFEQREKALPMGDFEKMVAEVARIEQALGVYDLARFTPKT
jgi:hemerythrin-like domain-containing protein